METGATAPVGNTNDFVSLIDKIVGSRPGLPPLVIMVTSNRGDETARKFIKRYHKRLSAANRRDNKNSLVPHALADRAQLDALAEDMPDVQLLDNISVVKVVFRVLNRRWFERHLNGRKLHWFGKHVAEVTEQQHEDFSPMP